MEVGGQLRALATVPLR